MSAENADYEDGEVGSERVPYEYAPGLHISTGSKAEGYPCPKDGTVMELIDTDRAKGAWCPKCHTVWTEVGEIPAPCTCEAVPWAPCLAHQPFPGRRAEDG